MKHFHILVALLLLALVLSACGSTSLDPYEYTFSLDNQVKTIRINPETQTILDGTVEYRYKTAKSDSGIDYDITYPNGGTYWWMDTDFGGHGGWSDDYDESRYIPGNILIDALEQNRPRQRVGNVGLGLLLMGLGAVNFFLPEIPFYLKYGWAVENAEPSDAYITLTKTGGVISAIVGLIACII